MSSTHETTKKMLQLFFITWNSNREEKNSAGNDVSEETAVLREEMARFYRQVAKMSLRLTGGDKEINPHSAQWEP
jgi:hypothetical protein